MNSHQHTTIMPEHLDARVSGILARQDQLIQRRDYLESIPDPDVRLRCAERLIENDQRHFPSREVERMAEAIARVRFGCAWAVIPDPAKRDAVLTAARYTVGLLGQEGK